MEDPYNLQRFVDAQENAYVSVVEELKRGRTPIIRSWARASVSAFLSYAVRHRLRRKHGIPERAR